ncbi:MAG: hypothetical protein PHV55_03505 [Candidatus Omnitrophica bacterium]|nr:hypothetical protein [Candidatus Omnitrophota bacterium]
MDMPKTKSLERIEEKMEELDPASLRYHILESAKSFKTSWVSLGRALYSVYKDKLYKEWGYSTIEIYILKEIGIKKPTAMKLLRSYYFLEKEEPQYLQKEYTENTNAAVVPSYESIDLLRKAKNNKALDEHDYEKIKKNVFEVGKDPQLIKRDLTTLMRQRKEVDPQEEQERSRTITVKRYLSTLRAMKREIEISKLLPPSLLKETESLIEKLEAEVS